MRLTPGPNNKKLLQTLDRESANTAFGRALRRFSLFLNRALVVKSKKVTKRRTGTYARSWKVVPATRGIKITNRARTKGKGKKKTFYAKFLEDGTKAHKIAPNPNRETKSGRPPALAWRRDGRGPQSSAKSGPFNPKKFFFSKGHRVKGIKRKRVAWKTVQESRSAWGKILNQELEKQLQP